jgi:hypothetical protein
LDRRRQTALAVTAYAVLSLVLYGRGVLADPGGSVVGSYGSDQGVFMWALEWWPHAITHGVHSMQSDLVYAPDGWNLAWTTVIPGPALLLWPVTAVLGSVAAYNLLALSAPVLAAGCTFLLCRELCGRAWPSFVGGLVFGFSTFMSSQQLNHVNLALVFGIPLAAYLVVRHVEGRIGDRRFLIAFAATEVALFSIFLETFLTSAIAGLVALLVALAIADADLRRRLVRTAGLAVAGGVLALVLVSPYLYEAFARTNPIAEGVVGAHYPLDLANPFVPTTATAFHPFGDGTAARHLAGNVTEQSGYLGPVVIGLLILVPFALHRSRLAIGTLAFAVLVFLAALGPRLHYRAVEHGALPFAFLLGLPVLRNALPVRFTVFLWLALAVLVALLLCELPAAVGVVIVAGLAITLAPSLERDRWATRVDVPAFFDAGRWRGTVHEGDNVLIVPVGFQGNAMYWQARTGFAFRQTGGYVASTIPPAVWHYPFFRSLYGLPLPTDPAYELRRLLHDRRVDVVVLKDGTAGPWRSIFASLGVGTRVGGVTAWRVPRFILAGGLLAPQNRPGLLTPCLGTLSAPGAGC